MCTEEDQQLEVRWALTRAENRRLRDALVQIAHKCPETWMERVARDALESTTL